MENIFSVCNFVLQNTSVFFAQHTDNSENKYLSILLSWLCYWQGVGNNNVFCQNRIVVLNANLIIIINLWKSMRRFLALLNTFDE